MKNVYTTGQVARITNVANRTVAKWLDTGLLPGYRIPGSRDRRIPREQLIPFLKQHGLPLGELEREADDETPAMLIVGAEEAVRERLTAELSGESFRLDFASCGFDAGIQVAALPPDCVVVDFRMGRNEAVSLARRVRREPEHANAVLIGLLGDDDELDDSGRSLFTDLFREPFDPALVAERIRTLIGRKAALAAGGVA